MNEHLKRIFEYSKANGLTSDQTAMLVLMLMDDTFYLRIGPEGDSPYKVEPDMQEFLSKADWTKEPVYHHFVTLFPDRARLSVEEKENELPALNEELNAKLCAFIDEMVSGYPGDDHFLSREFETKLRNVFAFHANNKTISDRIRLEIARIASRSLSQMMKERYSSKAFIEMWNSSKSHSPTLHLESFYILFHMKWFGIEIGGPARVDEDNKWFHLYDQEAITEHNSAILPDKGVTYHVKEIVFDRHAKSPMRIKLLEFDNLSQSGSGAGSGTELQGDISFPFVRFTFDKDKIRKMEEEATKEKGRSLGVFLD